MKSKRWKLAAIALTLAGGGAFAQTYPAKPVVWIVPFAAGGPTDALARNIAERVAREIGQPILIENTPGAGGTVGAAKASPCWWGTWATWARRRRCTGN
jgi:tripartite-type tricarboxylate transporter receptor subunit TctC